MIAGCNHIIHGGPTFMVNRQAQCPYCSAIFILTNEHVRRQIVHCLACTFKGKPVIEVKTPVLAAPVDNSKDDIFASILGTAREDSNDGH